MNVIFILIAVSLMVAIGFLGVFIWSIRAGQYDDEYTPSVRILFDDETNIIEDQNEKSDTGNPGSNSKFQIPNSPPERLKSFSRAGKQIQNTKFKNANPQEPMTNNQ